MQKRASDEIRIDDTTPGSAAGSCSRHDLDEQLRCGARADRDGRRSFPRSTHRVGRVVARFDLDRLAGLQVVASR